MNETIYAKLESSRKELLDLSLWNPLLNYKITKTKGIKIVEEKSDSIFDIFVRQNKSMSFSFLKENEILLTEKNDKTISKRVNDTKLNTNYSEKELDKRLLNTYYAANSSIEEQGVNILYLTLGVLNWLEDDNSEEQRKAPLILIPVKLERDNASDKYKLSYTTEEIGSNLSLEAKLKNDFNLNLPKFPDVEDLDVYKYFEEIAKIIESKERWSISKDSIELGFFSFGKFMIYNDLDNSKWPEHKKPINNEILIQLFETGFKDESLTRSDDNIFIDIHTNADELFQVVDADSSQILAILAANEGKHLIIQGPPGTGKSQTITNIIANAIGSGKKVLFVAEKMAALKVVKRRLDSLNIGDSCLELHSHKANKKDLHAELKRVIELGKPNIELSEHKLVQLSNSRNELNEYCFQVNKLIKKSGLTPQMIYGKILKLKDEINLEELPKINIVDIDNWSKSNFEDAVSFAERIEGKLKEIGIPNQNPFWGSELTLILFTEENQIKLELKNTLSIIDNLTEYVKQIQIQLIIDFNILNLSPIELIEFIETFTLKPNLSDVNINSEAFSSNIDTLNNCIQIGLKINSLKTKYNQQVSNEIWGIQSTNQIKNELINNGKKWYKFLLPSFNKKLKYIKSHISSQELKSINKIIYLLNDIQEFQSLEYELKKCEQLLLNAFNNNYDGINTNWQNIIEITKFINNVILKTKLGIYPKTILNKLDNITFRKDILDPLKDKFVIYNNTQTELFNKLKINIELNKRLNFNKTPIIDQKNLLQNWQNNFQELNNIISWNALKQTAHTQQIGYLTDISEKWDNSKFNLKQLVKYTWYEYLLEYSFKQSQLLINFESTNHDEISKKFKELDLLKFNYNKALVSLKHWENIPKNNAGGQVNILKTEFNKKSRHKPIRKLISEAGLAIQAIKPVFMMSPLSIANFIPPDSIDFDIVIFDEASQVKPVDALGAILRSKQVIVVGDSKQLPPTSFFDSLSREIDEDVNITSDIESILGMFDSKGVAPKMLRWHYRSKHESLITFSNYEFYDNKLVIFPSPTKKDNVGLKFNYLANTYYDRGNTRTNQLEAEIVADAVMNHAKNNSHLTLGVAAFSVAQRQAIIDAVEIRRKNNPELEDFFRSHVDEPFFIKNLENVQGDERDVIFISIGYGKTKDGYLSMSFGPLNNDGGEKRLNVLITRAKLKCEVFTNIKSSDIDLNRTNSLGIISLKRFLHYAEYGILDIPIVTGKEADSPFEEMVANALRKYGYIVKHQIGSNGFFIDLAIEDKNNPGNYILGIECDGASYHSSRSARDRDRLRQQVLEGIGWRLHRIWSTDWFKNPDRELKKTIEAINKSYELKEIDKIKENLNDVKDDQFNIVRNEYVESSHSTNYKLSTLPKLIIKDEFHNESIVKISNLVYQVVKIEGPVHIDEVARRIIESANLSKVGSRIKEHVIKSAKYAEKSNKIKIKGDFLWPLDINEPLIRDRSTLLSISKKIAYIADEEIELLIKKIIKDSIAIDLESLLSLTSKTFGFNRITEDIRAKLVNSIKNIIKKNEIIVDNNLYKMI